MKITLAHGSGGKYTSDLINSVFEDSYGNDVLSKMEDSADKETAEKVAEQLLADGTIKFSSAFRPNTDTATFTVSEPDKARLEQLIADCKQNEKKAPDISDSNDTAEQSIQETEPNQNKKESKKTEAEKAMEIITNAVQSAEMTEEQDKALALVQKLIERQVISDNPARHQNGQETENIQNNSETAEKQSRNTNKTPEKQLSFFDAVPEQEYQPEKPKQELQLSFLDYITARQTELDTYRVVAEICLDSIVADKPELHKELTEILTKKFDENLHSSEPIITEHDLQECIEQNHVNTWLADFVNEVIEENMPEQNQQRKQQIQHNF